MTFDRKLWRNRYTAESFPTFPCPEPDCKVGRLCLSEESFSEREPKYSLEDARNIPDWEPEWTVRRFIGFLICNNKKCGEVCAISGDVAIYSYYVHEENEQFYESLLILKSAFPAPHLIAFPREEMPEDVESEIKMAFQLYWANLGACASKLRISVERILDNFKIPTLSNLEQRIREFEKIYPDHAETMNALRHVGNLGVHEGKVAQEVLLDAFEIYEDALAELYGQRSEKIKALKQKLIEAKGKY